MPYLDTVAMFLIGLLVFGPQMLIGVAAAELSHKNAAATATGFAGCFAYVGAAVAGYPLAKITQDYGWEGFFWALTVCGLVATLLLIPLWPVEAKLPKQQPKEPEPANEPATA
jgi:MFS transporter, OPA family, sugar phosphate sensor protein UhpC